MSQSSERPKPPAPRGAARPFSRPAPASPARPEAPRPPSDRNERATAPRPFVPARRAAPAIPPSPASPYVPNNEPDLTRLSAPLPELDADDSPAIDAPAAVAPAHEAPAYEAPAYDAPGDETAAYEAPVYEAPMYEASTPADAMSEAEAAAALDAAEIAAAPFDSVDLTPADAPMLPAETSWGAAGFDEPTSVDELLFGEGALDGFDSPRDPFADTDGDGLPLGLGGGSALDDALPQIEAEAHASTEPDPFASSHDEPDALASEPFPFAPRTQAEDVADRLEALAARVRAGELDVSVALPGGGDESALAATLLAIVRLRG
jgi:hypothetical protein